jgi:tetratricopeptide (TPR) repeat protein
MNRHFATMIAGCLFVIFTASFALADAHISKCNHEDAVCKRFEQLVEADQPENVVREYEENPKQLYTDQAMAYVGAAYLALASRDDVSPEKEEAYYRKALSIKHYVAYMGLYFFYAQKDEEKALGFLREYVKLKPADTVPYVILGEAELNRQHYDLADSYLRDAKKVARAYSPRVDWLLFQTDYLMKNYKAAGEMFESAVTRADFANEIRSLATDSRYTGIDQRPEFKKYEAMLKTDKP